MFSLWSRKSPSSHSRSVQLRVESLEKREVLSVSHVPTLTAPPTGLPGQVRQQDLVIVSQPYDGTSNGAVAQVFPDMPSITSYEYDDFTTLIPYNVTALTVPGIEQGRMSFNKAVTGEILNGLPGKGGQVVMSGSGSEDSTGTLHINFNSQTLAPGSYWITAFVTRPFGFHGIRVGGQWFWDRTTPVNGSEEYFRNPSGGFGFGRKPIPGSVVFGSPADMAFELDGNLPASPNSGHVTTIQQLTAGQSHAPVVTQDTHAVNVPQQNTSKVGEVLAGLRVGGAEVVQIGQHGARSDTQKGLEEHLGSDL